MMPNHKRELLESFPGTRKSLPLLHSIFSLYGLKYKLECWRAFNKVTSDQDLFLGIATITSPPAQSGILMKKCHQAFLEKN